MWPRVVAVLGAVVLLLAACEDEPAALRVGGVGYSTEELGALTTAQLERLTLLTTFGLVIAEERVDDLIRPILERERADRLIRRLTLDEAARHSGLDDAELRAAYLQDPEYELTVQHLVVLAERWRDDAIRAEARTRAAAALDRARAGEDFRAIASEVSEEPGAPRTGGLLPAGRQGTWVPEFWDAARSLEPGEISEIVETQFGFHVIRLLDRDTIPFDSVRYEALNRIPDVVAAVPRARGRLMLEQQRISVDLPAALEARDRTGDPQRVIATTPTGSFTAADLWQQMRALGTQELESLQSSSDVVYEEVVRGMTGTRMLVARASAAGVTVGDESLERVAAEWRSRIANLASIFGFQAGAGADELKAAAMVALADPRQSTRIALADLSKMRPALDGMYEVRSDTVVVD